MGISANKWRWHRRLVHGPVWFLAWVAGVSAVAALWLAQGAVTLPDAGRDALAARLADAVAGAGVTVQLGGATVELRDGLVPVAVLSDLRLSGADGGDLAVLDRVETVLDRGALLGGTLRPQALRLSGVALTVARDAEGLLSVRLGDEALVRDAAGPGAALDALRAALDRPALQALHDLGIEDLTLRFEDAREGRLVTARGGRLALARRGTALQIEAVLEEVAVPGAVAEAGRAEFTLSSAAPGAAADLRLALRGLVPADLAALGGTAPLTELLQRIAAPVTLELSAGLAADGSLGAMRGRIAVGDGSVAVPGLAAPLALRHAAADLALSPGHDLLRLSGLEVASDTLSAKGALDLSVRRRAGEIAPVVAQLRLRDLRLDRPDLLPERLVLDLAAADARFQPDTGAVRLDGIVLRQGGLTVTGRAGLSPAGDLRADLAAPRVTADQLPGLWPQGIAPGTRAWLFRNLRQGALEDVTLALRREAGAARPEIGLSFGFSGGVLRPMRGLPLLHGASGRAGLIGREFRLQLDGATMPDPLGGTITVGPSTVVQPDIAVRGNTLRIDLAAEAATGGLLALLRLPVFRGADAAAPDAPPLLTAEAATGRVDLDLSLGIPLRPGLSVAAVDYTATGTVTGFRSDSLVGTRPLRAGPLALEADPLALTIAGPVTISGQPMDIRFRRPMDRPGAEIAAGGALSAPLLETFGVRLPPGTVAGAGRFAADIALEPGAAPRIAATGSLEGMTLSVPALGWSKPAGAAGSAEIAGRLGPDGVLETVRLRAPGLTLDGRAALPGAAGGDPRLTLLRLVAGTWLDASAELAGGAVALTGGTLDLRRRPAATGGGGSLDVALDRVLVSQGIVLRDVRGRLAAGGGRLTASVGGVAPVRIDLDDGAIRVSGGDAGAVLRGAGLTGQVRGGALDLRLVPEGRGFRGRLRVTDTVLRDTPATERLVSGVGAAAPAAGQGIDFDDVRADFRLTESRLTLLSGSAEGPSLGLSLDGVVALDSGALNLQGVVSPVYFLNRAGSFMTRRGEGLVGMSFRVQGTRAAPRLELNPLSVLTPGFLREIFRSPSPGGQVTREAPGQ